MSGPEASRNPFMPPPNTITVSAAAWSRQNITFNVLFNIMDQGREEEVTEVEQQPSFQDLSTSSTSALWPLSDHHDSWSPHDPANTSQDNSNSHNVDQILNSIGQVLSGFSSVDPQFHLASCAMCLQPYLSDHLVVVLPCHPSHFFHRDCLRDWFKEYLSCPMCRRDFTQS